MGHSHHQHRAKPSPALLLLESSLLSSTYTTLSWLLTPSSSTPSSSTWYVLSSPSHTSTEPNLSLYQDGTLTDSIAAVEAAWGKVAKDIGQDPQFVIAATHGKRAVDNLARFRPDIKAEAMADEVQKFEETILYFADAYHKHGPGSQTGSPWPAARTPATPGTPFDSALGTPDLSSTPSSSAPSSRPSSRAPSVSGVRRPSFGTRLGNMLAMTVVEPHASSAADEAIIEDVDEELAQQEGAGGLTGAKVGEDGFLFGPKHHETRHELKAWQIEASSVDRSVQILPGVKRIMDSIPRGRYAVATSGAKTYGACPILLVRCGHGAHVCAIAYGCMTRVGITPPEVTITADDRRLKAGKPAPDPFLLAADCLGFDARRCVVFEDSPSGIRAGVASGATVVAVCTSHERAKIADCGAHFIVENMEKIVCTPITDEQGKMVLRFDILA